MKTVSLGLGYTIRLAFAFAAVSLLVNSHAMATNLFWSGNGTTQGGAGTWNTTVSRFATAAAGTPAGTYGVTWNNANTDSAEFGGTSGTVNLGGPIVVNTITTDIGGFTIGNGNGVGGAANTITFSGANAGINTNHTSGTTTFLTALVSGTLTKTGAGRLEMNNTANPTTSKYVINAGIITTPAISRFGTNPPAALVPDFLTFNGGGWGISTGNHDTAANRGITVKSGGAFFGQSAASINFTISSPIVGTEGGGISLVGNSGPFTNSAFVSGAIVTLTNTANSWNGGATVTLGTLKVGAAGVIPDAATVTLNGGNLDTQTFNETVGTVVVNSASSSILGTGVLTGSSYDMRNSNTTTTTGIQAPLGGTGVALTKTTAGTVLLGAVNTYTGDTTITAGTLSIDADATLGSGAGTVKLNGGTLNETASRSGAGGIVINPVQVVNSSSITSTSTAATPIFEFSGALTGASGKTLTFQDNAAAATQFKPRFSGSFTMDSDISLLTGTGALLATVQLESFNATGTTQTFTGTISGGGSFNRSVSAGTGGDTVFTGNNTFSGGTTLNAGRIGFGSSSTATTGPIGTGGLTVTSANTAMYASGGSRVVSNAITLNNGTEFTGSNDLEMSGTVALGTVSRTLTVTNTAKTILSGVISDTGGTGKIVKQGSGVLTLTGANTYGTAGVTGTTVSAGKLLVNNTTGSGTGPGDVLVNGGTLGGTGKIAGSVTVSSGSLAPGASINVLGIGGNLTFTGGSFDYEINRDVAPAVGADLNNVTGNLSLTAVALSAADLGIGALPLAMGTKFTLINYGGTWNGGIFTGLADHSTSLTIGLNRFAIEYADTTGGANFGGGSVGLGSHFVTITAVPEASTFLTIGLGGIFAIAAVWMSKRVGINLKA